jgi:hypothetical protein
VDGGGGVTGRRGAAQHARSHRRPSLLTAPDSFRAARRLESRAGREAAIVELRALAARPNLVRQYELLVRLQRFLAEQADCLGAAVGGSLAAGMADSLSDVDLIVYCKAGAAKPLSLKLSSAAADQPVVHRLTGQHDSASVFEKVILADWSSYEIHVIEPGTRMRLRPPYIQIVDNDAYLSTRVSDDKPIGRGTVKPFVNGQAGLVWELFNCIKWLRRGQTELTVQYLRELGARLSEAPPPDTPSTPPDPAP